MTQGAKITEIVPLGRREFARRRAIRIDMPNRSLAT
jgi:hypothetical protein